MARFDDYDYGYGNGRGNGYNNGYNNTRQGGNYVYKDRQTEINEAIMAGERALAALKKASQTSERPGSPVWWIFSEAA